MSLDVYLTVKNARKKSGTGVFIRDAGKTRELRAEEVKDKWPDTEVAPQEYETNEIYDGNITHNLGKMAGKAGIYYALWRPEEKGWKYARDIINILEKGLTKLKAKPEYYRQFSSENGWGTYEQFVPFVEEYLNACKEYPDAEIEVSR